jgi:hypothetical protein
VKFDRNMAYEWHPDIPSSFSLEEVRLGKASLKKQFVNDKYPDAIWGLYLCNYIL